MRNQAYIYSSGGSYYYRIQDIKNPSISGAQGAEPNPEVSDPWIAIKPTWWTPYVIDWHVHH